MASSGSGSDKQFLQYQIRNWILTFLTYAAFHMTRKTYSAVKSTLRDPQEGWYPFTKSNGKELLSTLDTIFLIVYSFCLFFSGHIADRSNLRIFIPLGLSASAVAIMLWAVAYTFDIHSFAFFAFANVLSGLFQSSGWPACVAVTGNWFKGKRGLIMAIWNSHTSVGNMLGSLLGALMIGSFAHGGWAFAFMLPSIIALVIAILVALFLVPSPSDVGLVHPHDLEQQQKEALQDSIDNAGAVNALPSDVDFIEPEGVEEQPQEEQAVSFLTAILIPGVLEFSFSLFFCKLVAYAFLFWLPYYLKNFYDDSMASYLSIYFDLGGIVGGILCGFLSDKTKRPGSISVGGMVIAIPMLFVYRWVSSHKVGGTLGNVIAMFLLGAVVNGPYALITTAVSADLGSHPKLGKNSNALATVSGVIDGFGSLGATANGIFISIFSKINSPEGENWSAVFYMLMGSCTLSAVFLTRVVFNELTHKRTAEPESDTYVVEDDILGSEGEALIQH